MADLKSTYQRAVIVKATQGKVVHLSYTVSMKIDKSISTTLSGKAGQQKK